MNAELFSKRNFFSIWNNKEQCCSHWIKKCEFPKKQRVKWRSIFCDVKFEDNILIKIATCLSHNLHLESPWWKYKNSVQKWNEKETKTKLLKRHAFASTVIHLIDANLNEITRIQKHTFVKWSEKQFIRMFTANGI